MNSDYLVGKVIGNRYEIVEKVGVGGMAAVYKARCHVLNRYVAIKVLKDSLKFDPEVVKKFNTESRAAARLSHPNIVQVYDVGESDGLDYIVMEFVDGITLKEYIQKNGRLSWEEACNYAMQIGKALDCAHANNIVHRDIKPHNVIMARDGRLKVADFGIAQAASSETMVAGSSGMGSVHYISPEQARGGFTNERSDIYSLGVVLYEMLTGEVPFNGANPVAIAIMKLEQEPKDCRELNPYIPHNVAEIAMKAISREQHSRYRTAAEMVSELEAVIGTAASGDGSAEDEFETKRIKTDIAREEYNARRREKKRKEKQRNTFIGIGVIAAALLAFVTYFSMGGGTQEYQVPNLSKMTVEEAEQALKEAELRLDEDIEFEASEDIDEGLVIRQSPGFNQYVKKNRKIKITVSSGLTEGETVVPDVENLIFEEAKKRLEAEGLKCKRVEEFSEIIQFEHVIRQSPKGETKVTEGYTVSVYVSADIEDPNAKVTVPKLTGYTVSQARALLEQAGLELGAIENKESETNAGTILEQSPKAQEKADKGTTVNIVVSSGKKAEATPTPSATPTSAPTTNGDVTNAEPTPKMMRKTLTIHIPSGTTEKVNVRAVANGKEIYSREHLRSDGSVDIPVQSSKDASVQVYIDGALVADKVIEFD